MQPARNNWTGAFSWDAHTTVYAVAINMFIEMNAFLLKAVFEIPTDHNLNLVRLLLWAAVCGPAISSLYYTTNSVAGEAIPDKARNRAASTGFNSAYLYVPLFALGLECAVIAKHGLIVNKPH